MTQYPTALHANPFYFLGASVRDDRQRIVELADNCLLERDHDACSKARAALLTPRLRLGAEMAWLPGVSPHRARQFVERLSADPSTGSGVGDAAGLAKANLLGASLEVLVDHPSASGVADRLVELARAVGEIDPAEVLRDINEDRTIARLPLVASEEAVVEELAQHMQYFRTVIRSTLDRLPARQLVSAVTQAVSVATAGGENHPPSLIDELVDVYEVEAQEFLTAEGENITKLVAAIRQSAEHGDAAVAPVVTRLTAVARNWDAVAQPIQVASRARGTGHEMSRQIGVSIRSVGVDLFNEHQMLVQSRRITELLQEVFAELPEFAERLEEDADALDDIEESRAESQAKWALETTYRAELGVVLKDVLSISPDGVSWRGRSFPLSAITRMRWGGTRHSINGIPTGTTYTIAFGDRSSEAVVETRREDVFEAFVERMWKAVGSPLLIETLKKLRGGKEWWVSEVRVRDDAITLFRHKFWTREPVDVRWDRIRIRSEGGNLVIESADDRNVNVALSYIQAENAHVLDRMLRAALQRPGLKRLSDLLG